MSKAAMEIDFLGLEEGDLSSTFPTETSSSTRGETQQNPTLHSSHRAVPPPPSAETCRPFPAPVPATSPKSKGTAVGSSSPAAGPAAPMTIFYRGTVATFNLPRDKAEAIIRWAARTPSGVRPVEGPAAGEAFAGSSQQQLPRQPFLLEKLRGDLPLARKRSLQRFLQKRKER